MAGLYIHIPFCRKKCLYCDFYSVPYQEDTARKYLETLNRQLRSLKDQGYSFKTVYIGGGTPSVLEEDLLESLFSRLAYFLSGSEENTLEANPESLTKTKLSILKGAGINRLSIGVQSFSDRNLKTLGRIHTSKEAKESILLAQDTGFKNISVDLIFGIPGQSLSSLEKDLTDAVNLKVPHISCYALTYEKNTPLSDLLKNKKIKPVSEDSEYRMYKLCIDFLKNRGFTHYEISNFAKGDFQCRHNVNYWKCGEYTGLGTSASSFKENKRYKNTSPVTEYTDNKNMPSLEEELTPEKLCREAVILGLRMVKEGINFKDIEGKCGINPEEYLKEELQLLHEKKYLVDIKEQTEIAGIKLSSRGVMFFDEVASILI